MVVGSKSGGWPGGDDLQQDRTLGSLMVRGKNKDEYLLGPGDTLYIPPGEERSIEAVGTETATMLVIIVKLD